MTKLSNPCSCGYATLSDCLTQDCGSARKAAAARAASPSSVVIEPEFRHRITGLRYRLMAVANAGAERLGFVPTAVYRDELGVVWARPVSDFVKRFEAVHPDAPVAISCTDAECARLEVSDCATNVCEPGGHHEPGCAMEGKTAVARVASPTSDEVLALKAALKAAPPMKLQAMDASPPAADLAQPLFEAISALMAACTKSGIAGVMPTNARGPAVEEVLRRHMAALQAEETAFRVVEQLVRDLAAAATWEIQPPTPEQAQAFDALLSKPAPWDEPAAVAEKSATYGMNLTQRIQYVGGRENAQSYIEFGSVAAVRALVRHVLRDLPDGAPGFAVPAQPPRMTIDKLFPAVGHYPQPPVCWCQTCRPLTLTDMRMVLCPACGDKRCPHAANHADACTLGRRNQKAEHMAQIAAALLRDPVSPPLPQHRPSTDGAAVVSPDFHWKPIDAATPRGCKLQLINKAAGVATHGVLGTETPFWTHWAPLPTFGSL